MADTLSAAEIESVNRGTRRDFALNVARRASGEDLSIHVQVARGQRPGPTLALIANVHGDAAYGGYIISEFLRRTDFDFAGTVLAVPVANPIAFESATRTTGQGWNTDMNNMNRVFPGDHGGWVTQMMAATLAEAVISSADAVIDYHCGSDSAINYTLINGDRTPEQRRIFDYCRLMATDFIFVHETDPFVGTIDQYAKSLGKLCIVAEQGGSIMPDGFLDLSMTRIENFMKGLGMVDGEPALPETQLVMRPPRVLPRIRHGGFFEPVRGVEILSTVVEGGTVLGQLFDLHRAELLDEMVAPYEQSAMLSVRTTRGRANPGDYGYIIANAGDGETIGRPDNWRIEL